MQPTHWGKYEVVRLLGRGGFATVFLGRDPDLDRLVAIKVCDSPDPQLRRRFDFEAKLVAGLAHPHITTVYDFGRQDEVPYLVQEYLSGEDLADKIARRERLAPARRLGYLLAVARGLHYAHERGIVHRDVKPGNVRVLDDDAVKILDFGIAKLLSAERALTMSGMALGTVGYLPPEQLSGQGIDQRVDVFAFGALAYELLTYERPFRGEQFEQVLFSILHHTPAPLAELWPACPRGLSRLIARCLEKDPGKRFPGFAPLLAELEPLRGEVGDLPEPEAPTAPFLANQLAPTLPLRAAEPIYEHAPAPRASPAGSRAFDTVIRLGRGPLGKLAGLAAALALLLAGLWAFPRGDGPSEKRPAPPVSAAATQPAPAPAAAPPAPPLAAATPTETVPQPAPSHPAAEPPPSERSRAAAPGAEAPPTPTAPAPGSLSGPLSGPLSLLLSLSGEGVAEAESALIAALVESGRVGVVPDAGALASHAPQGDADEIAAQFATEVAAAGRREGTQLVLLGRLATETGRGADGLTTAKATLHLRLFRSDDGRLLATETVTAESPPNPDPATAEAGAAEAVGRKAAGVVVGKVGA